MDLSAARLPHFILLRVLRATNPKEPWPETFADLSSMPSHCALVNMPKIPLVGTHKHNAKLNAWITREEAEMT